MERKVVKIRAFNSNWHEVMDKIHDYDFTITSSMMRSGSDNIYYEIVILVPIDRAADLLEFLSDYGEILIK